MTSLSFTYGLNKTGLPIISVEIEGNYLCFIIDTGSTHNLIDNKVNDFFAENFTKTDTQNTIIGIDGQQQERETVIISFIFLEQEYSSQFVVMPLNEAFKDIEAKSDIQIHGILGTGFLVENNWIIDFDKMEIRTTTNIII